MKELKSSLDTIRKTASELITGIEGQLKELQRDREIAQEQPAGRVSLKARLAEKKALVSGQGREHEEQENSKKNQREM